MGSLWLAQSNHHGLSRHQRALIRNAALNIETNIKYLLLQYMTLDYAKEFLYQMSTVINIYSLSKLPMKQAIEYVKIANRFYDFLLEWSGVDEKFDVLSDSFEFCLATLRKLKDLYTGSEYPTRKFESQDSEPADLIYLRELVNHVVLDDDQRYMVCIELQRLQSIRSDSEILMNLHGV